MKTNIILKNTVNILPPLYTSEIQNIVTSMVNTYAQRTTIHTWRIFLIRTFTCIMFIGR